MSILFDNALKYSPAGGYLELRLEKQGYSTLRMVPNMAIQPVDQEKYPLLFDRFSGSDQSRNSKTGGYGFDLSITGSIVSAHKGKIQVESPDRMSLLVFFLPQFKKF